MKRERAIMKARREAMEFAERAHRRQMLGNVATSFFQSLAANRPLQVGSMMLGLKLGQGINAAIQRDRNWWQRIGDPLADVGLTAGAVAYLSNSDGGVSIQYDIPDVESPGGGGASGSAGDWFLPAADPRALTSRSRRR